MKKIGQLFLLVTLILTLATPLLADPPDPPTNVLASGSIHKGGAPSYYGDMIRITWNASAGAIRYRVYVSQYETSGYNLLTTTSNCYYEWTDAPVNNSQAVVAHCSGGIGEIDVDYYWSANTVSYKRYFRIKAINILGQESDLSSSWCDGKRYRNPKTPFSSAVKVYSDNQLVATGEPISFYSSYDTYTHTGLGSNESNVYKVAVQIQAYNETWIMSNSEGGTTTRIVDAPTGLSYSGGIGQNPQLSWNSSYGANSYRVYKDDGGGFSMLASGLTSTSYTDATVEIASEGTTYDYYVTAYNSTYSMESTESNEIQLTGGGWDKKAGRSQIPKSFGLSQNFPNPFNPVTSISYQLPQATHVTLTVYNVTGQEVAKLVNEARPAGFHNVQWDARNVASGTYFYRIVAGNFTELKKMVVIK